MDSTNQSQDKNNSTKSFRMIGLPAIAFCTGIFCAWIFSLFFNDNTANATEKEQDSVMTEIVQPNNSEVTDNKDSAFAAEIKSYQEQLESAGLLYAQVENMHEWSKDSAVQANCDSTFLTKIEGYYQIVQLLRKGKLDEAIAFQDMHHVLNDTHLWHIRAAYQGWKDQEGEHEYTPAAAEEAKDAFMDTHADIVSFHQINEIHLGRQEIDKSKKGK